MLCTLPIRISLLLLTNSALTIPPGQLVSISRSLLSRSTDMLGTMYGRKKDHGGIEGQRRKPRGCERGRGTQFKVKACTVMEYRMSYRQLGTQWSSA